VYGWSPFRPGTLNVSPGAPEISPEISFAAT
jgi:hypothetical protein